MARLVPAVTITVADLLKAGIANQRAGRDAIAEELYRRVLAFDPRQADALHLMATLELGRERPNIALDYIEQAVEAAPQRGEFVLLRAGTLARLSRLGEAAAAFAVATRLAPMLAVAHHGLGRAMAEMREGDPRPHYRRALALAPEGAVLWNDYGVATQQAVSMSAARLAYGRAVAIDAAEPFALRNLAGALAAAGQGPAALRRYREALAREPGDGHAWDGAASLLSAWGEVDAARHFYDRATAIEDPPGEAWSHRLFFLNFLPGLGFAEHYRENRRWAERIESAVGEPAPLFANPRDPERRLRLAYVSPELVAGHNQLAWLMPLLKHHDRAGFEILVYADVERPDAGTQVVAQAADDVVFIHGLPRAEQAARMRADRIDIAVNLCGWKATERALFAHRAAPIQVAYDNHVTTTGLRAIDVRITDIHVDPPGLADPFYSERLLRLESGYASHHAPVEAPEVTLLPALRNGHVTFGSPNQVPKLSTPTIALWSRLLRLVPDARLALKAYNLGDPHIQGLLRRRFAGHGIDPGRIILVGAVPAIAEHFRAVGEVDVGLDPFPFNGGKSTCDALWMGVPVVTLAGTSLMGRIGASLLARAGMPELVARDEDHYLQIAIELARDLPRLAAMRSGLRRRLEHSVLFDGQAHTRELERAYRQLWQDWCQTR
jgi:protein O-GlcNAc transferase